MSPETNRYKKIITAIIFLLTVGIITVGILINTNKTVHDFLLFVPDVMHPFALLIGFLVPSSCSSCNYEKTSLFDVIIVWLILLFILGYVYFIKKNKYESTLFQQDKISAINQRKKFRKFFIYICIVSFVSLVYFIEEFVRLGSNYSNGDRKIIITLILFLLSLILSLVWN